MHVHQAGIAAISFLASAVAAFPINGGNHALLSRAELESTIDDKTVVQFMLMLEHVENAFYHTYMDNFDDGAFAAAGLQPWVRGRFVQLLEHEDIHVRLLETALGNDAPVVCEYQYPVKTVEDFVGLSSVLENGATGVYVGYANILQDKELIVQAASIAITETRHATWLDSAVQKGSPWSGAFATPIAMDDAFSLLATFTVSCPPGNPTLPLVAHTPLAVDPPTPLPGSNVSLIFDTTILSANESRLFLAVLSGLNTTFVSLDTVGGNFTATVPTGLQGLVYAVVATTDALPLSQNTTITAPAVLRFPFDSQTQNAQ
ncbi:ferritin-like domain-containing protein [Amylostereum chailletii]|nr:ferritin-like domain-containing protein [Amylostereum chailletii]